MSKWNRWIPGVWVRRRGKVTEPIVTMFLNGNTDALNSHLTFLVFWSNTSVALYRLVDFTWLPTTSDTVNDGRCQGRQCPVSSQFRIWVYSVECNLCARLFSRNAACHKWSTVKMSGRIFQYCIVYCSQIAILLFNNSQLQKVTKIKESS